MVPRIIIVLSMLAITMAVEPTVETTTPKLCEASSTQHCTAMGYDYCKNISGVQSCYCSHQQNYTSVMDVIDKDLKCSITSSKYFDPHYWFRDLLAASVSLLVVFTLVSWAYLIPTYAKIDAMYTNTNSKSKQLHYIPLLPRRSDGSYALLPTNGYK
nr:ORF3a [Casuarina virus]UBB38817.1 ORF3a [Casuarina virus]UBB38823.1 ORF3a [Casuarina virus]